MRHILPLHCTWEYGIYRGLAEVGNLPMSSKASVTDPPKKMAILLYRCSQALPSSSLGSLSLGRGGGVPARDAPDDVTPHCGSARAHGPHAPMLQCSTEVWQLAPHGTTQTWTSLQPLKIGAFRGRCEKCFFPRASRLRDHCAETVYCSY